ncbi:hypothetical protein [Aureimonas sp. D3]|uniref:hypothetical protein n=1 Tax=Aureimonas sp. D3 TaxID=1638164 RepID=UPI000AC12C06|nr:hypothetical protein [Aureimonas sp. D3]
MPSTSLSYRDVGAIHLTDKALKSFARTAEEFTGGKCEFEITFADNYTIKDESIDAIIASDLFRTSLAKGFKVSSINKKGEVSHYFTLEAEEFVSEGRVTARLTGELAALRSAKSAIEDEVITSKPWYNILYITSINVWLFLILPIISLFIGIPLFYSLISYLPQTKKDVVISALFIALFSGFNIASLALYIGSKIKTYLCPPFLIEIGKGETLAKHQSDLRKRSLFFVVPTALTAVWAWVRATFGAT